MAQVAEPFHQQPNQQREEDEKKKNRQMVRARLVQRLVASGGNLPEFMNDLITTQAVVVAGTEAAAFILEGTEPDGSPTLRTVAHIRPDNVEESIRRAALNAFREIVTKCVIEDKDGAIHVGGAGDNIDPQFCLVTLLRNEDRVVAASAVITRCPDESRAVQRLSTMQLVAGYFDLFLLKRQNDQSSQLAKTHQDVFQFASTIATADNFHQSVANLCNELATRTGAARVAIGWVRGSLRTGRTVKLQGISHTEEFDKKQELSVQMVKVMEECLDQEEFVQYDPAGTSTENVTREAMALSQKEGGKRVASIPLRRKDEIIGVLTLEFPPEKPSTPAESTALAVAAELLAPQLYDRYQNDRYLITKTGLSIRDNTKKVAGFRQHTLAKVIILAVVGLLAFLFLYSPMWRVSAPFQFVPVTQRQVDAPFEGRIIEVLARPGDTVAAGQVLARLDVTDIEQQLLQARARALAADTQARALLSDNDPRNDAEGMAKQAEARQYQAEARIYERQIEKASIAATMDGILLEGDLRDRVGTVVRMGDTMFLVGDPSALKVEIQVKDRDVSHITPGQTVGTIATSGNPNRKIPVQVDRIVQASTAQGGENTFTVYATPLETDPRWRPNASGEARLDVEPKPLIWQWTKPLFDWVRLRLWI